MLCFGGTLQRKPQHHRWCPLFLLLQYVFNFVFCFSLSLLRLASLLAFQQPKTQICVSGRFQWIWQKWMRFASQYSTANNLQSRIRPPFCHFHFRGFFLIDVFSQALTSHQGAGFLPPLCPSSLLVLPLQVTHFWTSHRPSPNLFISQAEKLTNLCLLEVQTSFKVTSVLSWGPYISGFSLSRSFMHTSASFQSIKQIMRLFCR